MHRQKGLFLSVFVDDIKLAGTTQMKMEDAPTLRKLSKSECPDIWTRLPRHRWPKTWNCVEEPAVALERKLYRHPLFTIAIGERQFGKVLLENGWENTPTWECLCVHRQQGLFFLSVDIKKHTPEPLWTRLTKRADLEKPTPFLDRRECEPYTGLIDEYTKMFESWISAEPTEQLVVCFWKCEDNYHRVVQ